MKKEPGKVVPLSQARRRQTNGDNMASPKAVGRNALVEIHTETYRIRGTLFLPLAGEGGYNSRLSDFLNNPDKAFLPLTEVSVHQGPGADALWTTHFLAVNKRVVTMVRALRE